MLGWFGDGPPLDRRRHTRYAGEAESPDGKAFVIDVKNADGFAARLFIDEKTHLPLMVTYKGPQPRWSRRAAGRPGGDRRQAPARRSQPSADDEKEARGDEAKNRSERWRSRRR